MIVEHGVQITLHNITSKNQEQDVKVCCLVITELDQRVINKKTVILGELEPPVTTSVGQRSWKSTIKTKGEI